MKKVIVVVATCLAFASWAQSGGAVVEMAAGVHRIEAEVVNSNPTRMRGLMGRTSMPQQHGMLFVFDGEARHCMWMKNTLLPLSVAFIDDRGRIVNVEEMEPETEVNHCARQPVRYALEMNGGWFRTRGLSAGTIITGIDRVPPAR